MRTISLNGPSMYEILPRFLCAFTSRNQALDIFADLSWLAEEYHPYLAQARRFIGALEDHATVPTVCILGYGRPTINRLVVEKEQRGWRLVRYEMARSSITWTPEVGEGRLGERSRHEALLDSAVVVTPSARIERFAFPMGDVLRAARDRVDIGAVRAAECDFCRKAGR